MTIDKSGANLAALDALNAERETPIKIRQNKYLNNVVEQDHRAIKRRTRPMLGFKNFRCARVLLSGIELMHVFAKSQMEDRGIGYTRAEQFYLLDISNPHYTRFVRHLAFIATKPSPAVSPTVPCCKHY